MKENILNNSFYQDKKVLVTGHTGFKGTWLTKILVAAGAEVLGYSRCTEREPSLFRLSGVEKQITHVKGNVKDYVNLLDASKRLISTIMHCYKKLRKLVIRSLKMIMMITHHHLHQQHQIGID